MASLNAKASTGHLRVYGPALYDYGAPLMKERDQEASLLLLKIQHHYEEALRRLTVRWRSDVCLGVCVGLLDPVSNIIASTLVAATEAPVDADPTAVPPPSSPPQKLRDVERRSLDGLVAFLTCFFPYLADWEAVRYLLLAEADPIVAARIVVESRGVRCFREGSAAACGALKLALNCAMVAAKHPCPSQLAGVWLSLSSSLHNVAPLLSDVQPNFPRDILHSFHTLVKEKAHSPYPTPDGSLVRPWKLAARCRKRATKLTYRHSWSLRRVLLDTIHGFYLQALARLPCGYHRSLLDAGHCYGPFDPVSNIIINTIWYQATFPPLSQQDELDIVGTLCLMRIEARSFYGLVSFLCTCHQDLNADQAIRFLLDTALNLSATKQCSSVKEEHEAYRAATIAAWHPRPDAQAEFLSSLKAMSVAPHVLSLLQDGGQYQLSSQCVHQIHRLLCSEYHSIVGVPTQQRRPAPISERQFHFTMSEGRKQRRAHRRISAKVKAALRRYEKKDSGHSYQLHVVCGVNECVSGPDNCEGSGLKPGLDPNDDYYHHTHANFLATRNVAGIVSAPVLFFVELSNHDDDQDSQLLCCPVDLPPPGAGLVRCLFCEHQGIRIVHPALEGFHGHEAEFEKMVRGEDLYNNDYYPEGDIEPYTNHQILEYSEDVAKWVHEGLDEDCMYLSSNDFTIEKDDSDESEEVDDLE
ncbi:uncharacterized protein LOC123395687 isoform X2 [Hordeum vulgare subsp. vulgare]|uniref:uncharacterized protein LOC123395687 isoform X2 n=1 Tax=Hordeum vulgare subsp. vulgare TaxID=112509 RepID=UPI001D1A4615|nr:uncharacterized protein LOC123395687 isoform X2 [Hordeum vulgare subsp. vulgare]